MGLELSTGMDNAKFSKANAMMGEINEAIETRDLAKIKDVENRFNALFPSGPSASEQSIYEALSGQIEMAKQFSDPSSPLGSIIDGFL